MHARRTARARPDHVIEGRATVIERRVATPVRPASDPIAHAVSTPDIRPINDNAAGLTPFRQPRPASPDLVFQGSSRWSARSSAPRRTQVRPHAVPAVPDETARRKASVGVMVAVVATLSAWSVPALHSPTDATASTHDAQSATTARSGTVSGSGKGDRIKIQR